MANLGKSLYSNDWPQLEATRFASAAGGTAADFEQTVFLVPNPPDFYTPKGLNEGVVGWQRPVRLQVRSAVLVNDSGSDTNASGATNQTTFRLNVYRNGVLQGALGQLPLNVSTTLGTAVASADLGTVKTVTPAAMAGILPGQLLAVDTSTSLEYVRVISTTSTTFNARFTKTHATNATVVGVLPAHNGAPFIPADATTGTTSTTTVAPGAVTVTPASIFGIHVGDSLLVDVNAAQETVLVTAVTDTTFTATFANSHSGTWAIAAATSPATGAQKALGNGAPFELQEGDVVTVKRISNNVTGLATPNAVAQLDLTASERGR